MSTLESKDRCCGDYPALWRFVYDQVVPVVRSVYGTGEVETVGHTIQETHFDVVALTKELAAATFNADHPPARCKLRSGPDFICYVDRFVHVAKNYGGHFS